MIFVGDIALPYPNAIKAMNFPKEFFSKTWFGNLEGGIVNERHTKNSNSWVFNGDRALIKLIEQFHFLGFALANNHILDAKHFKQTKIFLEDNNIPYCGIGDSLYEANRPLMLNEDGNEILILNFGWEVIQCKVAKKNRIGVNPLTRYHVIETVKKALQDFPQATIITYMHWSYELESEPQPRERELAKRLIDIGVDCVIGSHSHRVGGFEFYNGKPIVYSLGNWMFKQNHYKDKSLRFPDFCNLELAFELNFSSGQLSFHFFNYNRDESTLTYNHTESLDGKSIMDSTPFHGMSLNEYEKWYKVNHYHKRKGLPIYYWSDHTFSICLKDMVNKVRDFLLHIIIKVKNR